DLSIGYRIDDYTEEDDGTVRVTRFTPLEASIVTVPADSRVGINRNHEEVKAMAEDTSKPEAAGVETRQQPEVKSELKLFTLDKQREQEAGAKKEAERRAHIRDLFSRYVERYGDVFADLQRACEDSHLVTVDKAKEAILDAIADGYVSVNVSQRQDEGSAFSGLPNFERKGHGFAKGGEDQIEKFARGAELALQIRSGTVVDKDQLEEARKGELFSMSPSELAREYLRINGERATGNREQIIGQALKRSGISHGTGHFASILENVANKSMLDGFMQAPESWSAWCQTRSIPDFKAASLLNLSLFSSLEEVREGEQYEHGDMSDIKESIQLATYGRLFTISRQALANDDLSALGDVPRAMGSAAAYKIGDIAYSVLTTNAALTQDATALFDAATHANYVTAGAAPSVATLNAGMTAMALQTDPQGKVLGIQPAHLLVPVALQTTAKTLIAATYDPAGTAGTLTPNPFNNSMTVVSDHRLDTANASGWYLAARANTVVVGFLNGQQTPYLESKDGWDVDGVAYKVRIDAAAAAADYRGLYYNDGVT
ncbi:MAG: Mu-like prophage major head subunit gpT family protein, partial [Thiogranum sp.]